jgi:uncharacterized protein YciI
MPYLIYALDHDGMEQTRETIREAHRNHLKSQGAKLLASGALLSEDKKSVIGGISLLDTDDKIEAARFAHEDPYAKAGLRKETLVLYWRKRWWNGEFLEIN